VKDYVLVIQEWLREKSLARKRQEKNSNFRKDKMLFYNEENLNFYAVKFRLSKFSLASKQFENCC